MDFKLIFSSFLVLCLILFFDILINIKKISVLKICLLLIVSSLFVMNYYAFTNLITPLEFIFVKSMRMLYICSTLLLVVLISSGKISRSVRLTVLLSVVFLIGMRLFNLNEIHIQPQLNGRLVFSVGYEFNQPLWIVRFILFILLNVALDIVIYHYLIPNKKILKENIYFRQLNHWGYFLSVPFFLLTFFGMLSILNILKDFPYSSYLFSFFSIITLVAIAFRPKFLNKLPLSVAFTSVEKPIGSFISSQSFYNIFFDEYYYLDENASLPDLADKLKSTLADIQQYIEEEFGLGMDDLLNKHRVAYLSELLEQPENNEFTIMQLSKKAGFSSTAIMYDAFSKFEGEFPSQYSDQLNIS